MARDNDGQLDQISEAIGGLRSAVRELIRRADAAESVAERRHAENQAAAGAMRESMASAIGELRTTASDRDSDTKLALKEFGQKLDDHAAEVARIKSSPSPPVPMISRRGLAAVAAFGLFLISFLAWLLDAAANFVVQWAASHWK